MRDDSPALSKFPFPTRTSVKEGGWRWGAAGKGEGITGLSFAKLPCGVPLADEAWKGCMCQLWKFTARALGTWFLHTLAADAAGAAGAAGGAPGHAAFRSRVPPVQVGNVYLDTC